jgi:capsid protein
LADIAAESGQDVDALLEQRSREIRKQKELGLMAEPSTEAEAKKTDDLIAETELEEKQQEEGGHA